MRFSPQSFVDSVNKLIREGDGALDLLIDAYFWAQDHMKEIHRCHAQYRQEWLREEIRRIFNADPVVYVRSAKRIGGDSEEGLRRGREIIKRVGISEAFRAEHLLTKDQMEKLRDELTKDVTVTSFRKLVDAKAASLVKMKTQALLAKGAVDFHMEFLRKERECKQLRAENEKLKQEIERLNGKISEAKKAYKLLA